MLSNSSEVPEDKIYPVQVISQYDELIARINPDSTWSVKWQEVVAQAYEPCDESNISIGAICRLLLAGRDNFLTTRWNTNFPSWGNQSFEIGCCIVDHSEYALTLIGPTKTLGLVNADGSWSVDWDEVIRTTNNHLDHWGYIAINGFCKLLLAARDNFVTKPMPKE